MNEPTWGPENEPAAKGWTEREYPPQPGNPPTAQYPPAQPGAGWGQQAQPPRQPPYSPQNDPYSQGTGSPGGRGDTSNGATVALVVGVLVVAGLVIAWLVLFEDGGIGGGEDEVTTTTAATTTTTSATTTTAAPTTTAASETGAAATTSTADGATITYNSGDSVTLDDVAVDADGTVTVSGSTSSDASPETLEVTVTSAGGDTSPLPVEQTVDGSQFQFAIDPAIGSLPMLIGSQVTIGTTGDANPAQISFGPVRDLPSRSAGAARGR